MGAARKRAGKPPRERAEARQRPAPPKRGNRKSRPDDERGVVSGMFRRRSLIPPEEAKGTRNSKRPKSRAPAPRRSFRERVTAARARIEALWGRARRGVMMALRLLTLCILVAAALAVGRLVEKHVRTSPAFATQEIRINGNERLDREQILEAASLAVGQNVFEIGPEDAQARLLRHPWIASAEVSRRLPGFFDVVIREHHAALVISLSETDDDPAGLYLVSEDGTVFKRIGEGDPVDLPVVTGIDRGRFIRDRAFRQSVLLEVVALLHDYRGAGLWRRMPIGEIHVESDDGLSLYVGEEALHVRLGRGPFRQKLRRLRQVLDQIEGQGSQAAYVYLDNVRRPDRVTVRLRD